jgi:hypothetical protein
MSKERRYSEDEVAEIFRVASEARGPVGRLASGDDPTGSADSGDDPLGSDDGATLAELQDIGREAGIDPDQIALAASRLGVLPARLPRRSHFGMPIGVGRVVPLARAPSEREWEILVTELRDTFRAQGRDRSNGNLKSWANGNLRADVEPTQEGYRLKLQTLKSGATAGNVMGGSALALAAIGFVASQLLPGGYSLTPLGGMMPMMLAAWGGATLAWNGLSLPRWARKREEQMEHIADRATALIGRGERD